MKGDEYYAFIKKRGKYAKEMLDNAIERGWIDYKNPSENDIKKLKTIFNKARRKAKKRSSL